MKLSSYPNLVKEWHPSKNGELTPNDITHGSDKKVWWLCSEGHSYDAAISKRTRKKRIYDTGTRLKKEGPTGCPYCTGQKVGEDNNLLAVFPEIAKEWHPTKNGDFIPADITYGSTKKVWWLCSKGHSYDAAINSRTNRKSGCPKCSNQSSEPEIRILSELKWLFDDVKSRYKLDGIEIDIFLPTINVGIEYDGKYWHKDIEATDLKKNKFLLSNNINLIRVRQHPLKPLTKDDLLVNKILKKTDLDEILKKIAPFADSSIKEKIGSYLNKYSFVNEELFKTYRSYFPSPFPENSLLKTHPFPSSEWDYEKNHPLRPENFSFGSDTKAWWLCPKGHSYDAAIKNRTNKDNLTGCPYCSGNKTLNLDLFK
ncbi:zinc-ribbon domain-containing protein [Candidatus Thioglobus sp.]|nr:zinc-ribbon domain-containing protein [Candidatus Thioglobus sp.]